MEESARPLLLLLILRLRLKFVALMMVMRLIIKSIASVTPITKPVVVPGMIPVLVVVSSPILKEFPSELVVVIPFSVDIVVGTVSTVHHLMHLERVLTLLLLSLLLMVKMRFDLLGPTSIHFGVAIIFKLPLPFLPPFI